MIRLRNLRGFVNVNPHNVDLENGLAISYYKLSEIYRAVPNSDTDPAPYYRRAVEIWERILQRTEWPKLEGYIEHVKKRLKEGGYVYETCEVS